MQSMQAGMRAGAEAIMARAFHAASPLPSFKSAAAGGIANIQWLLKKRATTAQHGHRQPASLDAAAADDDEELEEGAAMFTASTPSAAYGGAARKRGEALARLRSAIIAVVARARHRRGRGRGSMGSSVTGTIFGRRRGRVHVALQPDPRAPPALIVELAAYSTDALVREMSSGLVRIALECEKAPPHAGGERRRAAALVEEPTWRAYCNGRKCGYAVRRECGAEEWQVLRAVEPVSVGAGVLPDGGGGGGGGGGGEGDLMYMRARFERVVGSRDSEAFYMVNPDGNGGPELSIYLLRV